MRLIHEKSHQLPSLYKSTLCLIKCHCKIYPRKTNDQKTVKRNIPGPWNCENDLRTGVFYDYTVLKQLIVLL